MSLFITRQLGGYVDADPSSQQEKALPLIVFRELLRNGFTPNDEALVQLAAGAFFFGCRNCEYLNVEGVQKTKILEVGNIRFFKNNIELKDNQKPLIQFEDTVYLTFVFQNNNKKIVTVSHPRSSKTI